MFFKFIIDSLQNSTFTDFMVQFQFERYTPVIMMNTSELVNKTFQIIDNMSVLL